MSRSVQSSSRRVPAPVSEEPPVKRRRSSTEKVGSQTSIEEACRYPLRNRLKNALGTASASTTEEGAPPPLPSFIGQPPSSQLEATAAAVEPSAQPPGGIASRVWPREKKQRTKRMSTGGRRTAAPVCDTNSWPETAEEAPSITQKPVPGSALDELSEPLQILHSMGVLSETTEASSLQSALRGGLLSSVNRLNSRSAVCGRVTQLLPMLEPTVDENEQLLALDELSHLLLMNNESSLVNYVVKQLSASLTTLLRSTPNYTIATQSCRCFYYMLDVQPETCEQVMQAAPELLQKLQSIECIDVAEKSLLVLQKLSQTHPKTLLQRGAVPTCLQFLDFFSLPSQREALSVVSHCCSKMSARDLVFVRDSLPQLCQQLTTQTDSRCIERVIETLSYCADAALSDDRCLKTLVQHDILSNAQRLLVQPDMASSSVKLLLEVLCKLSWRSAQIAAALLKAGISQTLAFLLTGGGDLITRHTTELYDIVCLACELLPRLNTSEELFEINCHLSLLPTFLHRHLPPVRLGRATRSRSRRAEETSGVSSTSSVLPLENVSDDEAPALPDCRLELFTENSQVLVGFTDSLLAPLLGLCQSTSNNGLICKCVEVVQRIVRCCTPEQMHAIIARHSLPTHITSFLSAIDKKVLIMTIQLSEQCIAKCPEHFLQLALKEGVLYRMETIRDQINATPPVVVPPPPIIPPPAADIVTCLTDSASGDSASSSPTSSAASLKEKMWRKMSRAKGLLAGKSTTDAVPNAANPLSQQQVVPPSYHSLLEQLYSPQMTPQSYQAPVFNEWLHRWTEHFLSSTRTMRVTSNRTSLNSLQTSVNKLQTASPEQLYSCLVAVKRHALSDHLSQFELIKSTLIPQLVRLLTFRPPTGGKRRHPSDEFIAHHIQVLSTFVAVFTEQPSLTPSVESLNLTDSPLAQLLNRLLACLHQVEQFPVKVCESSSSAAVTLNELSSRPLQCQLTRLDAPTDIQQTTYYIKVDPLATLSYIARWIEQQQAVNGETAELLLNNGSLSPELTLLQAVSGGSPITPHSAVWQQHHSLQYRLVAAVKKTEPEKATTTRSRSSSPARFDDRLNFSLTNSLLFTEYLANDSLPSCEEPVRNILLLIRQLYGLQRYWYLLLDEFHYASPLLTSSAFVSKKLNNKVSRQLRDACSVVVCNLPTWIVELAQYCPFLLPFETRYNLFYITAFDRDRAVIKFQDIVHDEGAPALARSNHHLGKKRFPVRRSHLLDDASKVMREATRNRDLFEIQYTEEVGIGLGPTLEFYSLLSEEFQKASHNIWSRELITEAGLVQTTHGLYPAAALPRGSKGHHYTAKLTKQRFTLLGQCVAKALLDHRQLDIVLSPLMLNWLMSQERTIMPVDALIIDVVLGKSLTHIHAFVRARAKVLSDTAHTAGSRQLALDTIQIDGCTLEDCALSFTLPSNNAIDLKPGGAKVEVTMDNIEEYWHLVFNWLLHKGVSTQMRAFVDGFNSVFSSAALSFFLPHEFDVLLCGTKDMQWDLNILQENLRPDHGYDQHTPIFTWLLDLLAGYSLSKRRLFLKFVTGTPRLPVGGFAALHPPLTVVKKTIEGLGDVDGCLPSVMTCMNYLKLPKYSSQEVLAAKLDIAITEGQNAFHLS